MELCEDVDCPKVGAEVYAVSGLTVNSTSPAERIYLDTPARELNLEGELVSEIHATLEANRSAI